MNTEEDRRLLEEDKQKFRNIIAYFKKINAAMKEHNMKPSAGAKYYDDMFDKFTDIVYASSLKKRYDKEYVTLFREIAQITTDYSRSVYNELRTEQVKKAVEWKAHMLDKSVILRFVTDNPNYYK